MIETLLRSLPGIFYLYTYPDLRLVRWNKKSSNYLGLITLAIGLLWYRRAVQLGPLTIQEGVLR